MLQPFTRTLILSQGFVRLRSIPRVILNLQVAGVSPTRVTSNNQFAYLSTPIRGFASTTSSRWKMPTPTVLLPAYVKPQKYRIALEPDLEACKFTGTCTTDVIVSDDGAKETTITLHSYQLHLGTDVSFKRGTTSLSLTNISYNIKAQTVTFTFDKPLGAGPATLSTSFTGILNDEMAGLYRAKYTLRGASRNAAITQFEATDARRCFPCWDEPALKAVFDVTVTAPADRTVISNMTVADVATSEDGSKRVWHFHDTPKISTYLVAVVVGDYDYVSARGKNGVLTSIYTPVGKASTGSFALKVAVDCLDYQEKLFGIPYMGGSKCDHISCVQFAAGAMENVGAITYREAALLIDEKESSLATKQRVAQVVCHELSHQWFGNLVTMQWWDQLWLNEGFAHYCEYVVTDALFPAWRTFEHFTAGTQKSAFALDALASTHAIEVPVNDPDEINQIFDAISYNKGASVIRMAFDWLGRDVAFRGLHDYLVKHSYGNAITTQLWDALSNASGQPVAAMMRNWTLKPGYPYLYVAYTAASNGALKAHSIALQSRRFIAAWAENADAWPTASDFVGGPSLAAAETAATTYKKPVSAAAANDDAAPTDDWCIPVSVVVGGASNSESVKLGLLRLDTHANATAVGEGRDKELQTMADSIAAAAAAPHAHWVKLNAGHTSFYRTIYDSNLLARLTEAVSFSSDRKQTPQLGVCDRLGLIGDVAAGVSVGMTPIADLLTLVWSMRFDTDYNVWCAILDAVSEVRTTAQAVSETADAAIERFLVALLGPVVSLVGWEASAGEDSNTPLLRALVLRWAAIARDPAVISQCLSRFDAVSSAPNGANNIPADLRQLVYSTAAAEGGSRRWEALYTMFRAATLSEEQRRLMTALGRATDPELLKRALGLVLNGEVRTQDSVWVVQSVASNPGTVGRDLVWAWLQREWEHPVMVAMRHGFMLFSGIVGAALHGFDSKESVDEVRAWFAAHPAPSADRKIAQSIESIRGKVWRTAIARADNADVKLPAVVDKLLAVTQYTPLP